MSRYIDNFKDWNLKRELRRELSPSKAFLKSSRILFLNQVGNDLARGRTPIHRHVIKWRYALIAGVVGLSMTGGLMTYADAADVPATHPLYQLKRMSEDIRLGLSTPQEQVQLQQEYAERRVREINEIEAANPDVDSPTIEHLSNDFQRDADDTVDKAEELNFHMAQREALCQALLAAGNNIVPDSRLAHLRASCQAMPTPTASQ